jgi:hypothetical protein
MRIKLSRLLCKREVIGAFGAVLSALEAVQEPLYYPLKKGTNMIQRRSRMRGGGSGLAALAALFTTLCCLGFPALVGLLSALGAGILLSDRYLEPLLAATLLLTLLIAGLHLRQHHQPGPFALSLAAAGSMFFAIYGIGLLPHAAGGDSMADGMTALPTWSPYLAYGAILALLGAQVWDLWLYRRCAPKAAPVPTHSTSAFRERRKEGV